MPLQIGTWCSPVSMNQNWRQRQLLAESDHPGPQLFKHLTIYLTLAKDTDYSKRWGGPGLEELLCLLVTPFFKGATRHRQWSFSPGRTISGLQLPRKQGRQTRPALSLSQGQNNCSWKDIRSTSRKDFQNSLVKTCELPCPYHKYYDLS